MAIYAIYKLKTGNNDTVDDDLALATGYTGYPTMLGNTDTSSGLDYSSLLDDITNQYNSSLKDLADQYDNALKEQSSYYETQLGQNHNEELPQMGYDPILDDILAALNRPQEPKDVLPQNPIPQYGSSYGGTQSDNTWWTTDTAKVASAMSSKSNTAYNPNTDYAALISSASKSGTTAANLNALNDQRNQKIYDSGGIVGHISNDRTYNYTLKDKSGNVKTITSPYTRWDEAAAAAGLSNYSLVGSTSNPAKSSSSSSSSKSSSSSSSKSSGKTTYYGGSSYKAPSKSDYNGPGYSVTNGRATSNSSSKQGGSSSRSSNAGKTVTSKTSSGSKTTSYRSDGSVKSSSVSFRR